MSLIQNIILDLAKNRVYLTGGKKPPAGRKVIHTKRGKTYYVPESHVSKDIDSIMAESIAECKPALDELKTRWESGQKRQEELGAILDKLAEERGGFEFIEDAEDCQPLWDEYFSLPGNKYWYTKEKGKIVSKHILNKLFTHKPYPIAYDIESYNPTNTEFDEKVKEGFANLSRVIKPELYAQYIAAIKVGAGVEDNMFKESGVFNSDSVAISVGEGNIRPNASMGYIINVGEDYVLQEKFHDGMVLAHEFAHCLEQTIPEIKAKSQAFLKRRIAGLEPTPIYGGEDGDEIGVKDSFIHHYVGKIYKSGSTEVLSMGIEYLMKDPLNFYEQDPDHFRFVVDALGLL